MSTHNNGYFPGVFPPMKDMWHTTFAPEPRFRQPLIEDVEPSNYVIESLLKEIIELLKYRDGSVTPGGIIIATSLNNIKTKGEKEP